MTTPSRFQCGQCTAFIPETLFNAGWAACPRCAVPTQIDIFPAFFIQEAGQIGEGLLMDNEASCFFHPRKRAHIPCAVCGRFLCALCEVEFDDHHLCPSCIEAGKKKRTMKKMVNHRVLYDNISLSLAILPLLIFWFTIITAPIAIYFILRHWKSPSSVLPRTKVRFVLAFLFAVLQITGWILLLTRTLL